MESYCLLGPLTYSCIWHIELFQTEKLDRGVKCIVSGQFIHKINSNANKVHVKCHYILS